jgi:hypothetical protein
MAPHENICISQLIVEVKEVLDARAGDGLLEIRNFVP